MSSILDELRYLVDLGIKGERERERRSSLLFPLIIITDFLLDVTLLGQNVNSYCDTSETNVSLQSTKALSRGFRENYRTNLKKGEDLYRRHRSHSESLLLQRFHSF